MNKTYWKAKSILTENERIFYKMLCSIISLEDHIILCKVRMEDVIHVDFNLKNKNFSLPSHTSLKLSFLSSYLSLS